MSVLDELATQAERLVHGIDWDALDSRSIGVPLDPQQPAHLNYWVDYLGPAFNRAANVMNTLYYDPIIVNHAATEESLQNVWATLKSAGPEVWAQLNAQNLLNNAKMMLYSALSPLPIPAAQAREVLSYVWGVVMFGVKLHTTFAIEQMGRATMREHANRIVMICEAIALLDQSAALRQLKWDSTAMVELREQEGVSALKPFYTPPMATSGAPGLGLPPVIAVSLGVLGAIVLMYGIYRWTSMTTEVNKATLDATKEICSDPQYANDPAMKDRCVKVLGDALAKTADVNMFGASLAKYALIGGLVVIGVMFLPEIVRAVKGAVAESRKTAAA